MNTADLTRNLHEYLVSTGWVRSMPGPAGALWHHGPEELGEQRTVLAVPSEVTDDDPVWRGVVERLAAVERREPSAVAASIRYYGVDVTLFRAANDVLIAGTIPLDAGAILVSSARSMLRASASTAVRPRAFIRGNYSRLADEIADRARLAHTVAGSYIFPVLMPLSGTRAPTDSESLPALQHRIAYEPAERRVTRTLAQALTAVQQRLVQPAREPREGDIGELIMAGVSRELVVSLTNVVGAPSVTEFSAQFEWAPVTPAPGAIPPVVTIESEAVEVLTMAANMLRQQRRTPRESVVGPVVEVRHLPDEPWGEIAVQTMTHGRSSEVRVRLSPKQIDAALEWMRSARTVVAEGEILRDPGHPLRIDVPESVRPLDESFLPMPSH